MAIDAQSDHARAALRYLPRVVLLTHDGLYSRVFFDRFVATGQVEIVGVVLSSSFLHRGKAPLLDLLAFVRRVGLGYALYQLMLTIVLPLFASYQRYSTYCRSSKVPVFKTNDVNCDAVCERLRQLRPDFLLSFHFNQKILPAVLNCAGTAAINFHPSVLPSLGGVDPVWFHFATGGGKLGATLHHISESLDAGKVLVQKAIPDISGGLISANLRFFSEGGSLAGNLLANFHDFDSQGQAQTDLGKSYFGWQDIANFGFFRTISGRLLSDMRSHP